MNTTILTETKHLIRKNALDRALQLNAAQSADAKQIVADARLFENYVNEGRVGWTPSDIG